MRMSGRPERWFERIKRQAGPGELYALLYAMPKGADLHLHLSGAGTPADWYELARAGAEGVWVRTASDCGHERTGPATLRWAAVAALPVCCRAGCVPLAELTGAQRREWASRLCLAGPSASAEFFAVTGELKHLRKNPDLIEALLARVLRRAAAEHVDYVELQTGPFGYVRPDGEPETVAAMAARYRRALARSGPPAGVAARLLVNVSRTAPDVRARLRTSFALAARYPDAWAGVQLSGQEDRARQSLAELRSLYGSLRHRYPSVRVAMHAGEGFGEPFQVAPALAAGARRVGHGLSLSREPDTVNRMLATGAAVEACLVSNQLMGHVADPADHPARGLLRRGLPVCLATDNPGVLGSQLTDEFYLAATAWDCTWDELAGMARASLAHCFAPPVQRRVLLLRHERALRAFEQRLLASGWRDRLPDPRLSDHARSRLGISPTGG